MTAGTVFDIQRFCTHHGPGIRTTVFLKGCPLRCAWCHNPEGIGSRPILAFHEGLCAACGRCAAACPRGCHALADGGHHVDRTVCTACGSCAAACPSGALEIIGHTMTVAAVMAEVAADRPFYETSGGGMTLSGGEPTAQPAFARALLEAARAAGIRTAVETCGRCPAEIMRSLVPFTDLFLFDLKETDPERHREGTGADLGPILANLDLLLAAGAAVRLRCPAIPGHNDRPDHWQAVERLAARRPGLQWVERLPPNELAHAKDRRFGLELDAAPKPAIARPRRQRPLPPAGRPPELGKGANA